MLQILHYDPNALRSSNAPMLQQQLRSDAPASINDMAGPGGVGGLGERHHDHQEEHGDRGAMSIVCVDVENEKRNQGQDISTSSEER